MKLEDKLQEKVVNWVKDFSDKELHDLTFILGAELSSKKPTKLQQEFLDEFIGRESCMEYIQFYKLPENKRPYFGNIKRITSDIAEIYSFISFQANLRIIKLLAKISKLESDLAKKDIKDLELKIKLIEAVKESYEDGIFYKADGWSNVVGVLQDYNLITLPKE